MPDSQVDIERQEFGYAKEKYLFDVFDEKILKDKERREKNKLGIKIDEASFEEHIIVHWSNNDSYLRKFVARWRNQDTFVESSTGEKTYLLHTGDFVELHRDETAYFFLVDSCFVIVVDVDQSDGTKKRITHHMPGSNPNPVLVIESMLKKIEENGKVINVVIMTNSKDYGEIKEEKYKYFMDKYPHKFIDMDKMDIAGPWGSHDVFIKGNIARLYTNRGSGKPYDESRRIFGGEVSLK